MTRLFLADPNLDLLVLAVPDRLEALEVPEVLEFLEVHGPLEFQYPPSVPEVLGLL